MFDLIITDATIRVSDEVIRLYGKRKMKGNEETEERYRVFIQTIPDIIYEVDQEGRFTFVSDAIRQLGYSPEELIGREFREIIHPDDLEAASRSAVLPKYKGRIFGDRPPLKLFDERRTQERMTKNLELRLLLKDPKGGSIDHCYVEIHSSGRWDRPVTEKEKNLVGSIGIIRDITHHKQTEEDLRQTSQRLQRAMRGVIQAMTLTVEIKDPYTAGHQQRVANLARAIAREIDLSEGQIEGVYMAGLIHDIGKIYIPAEILNKPGRLSDIEFNLIKTHAQLSYDILKEIEFPWPVARIVHQHHERMDGSGYPQGLLGKDILIEARVLAVSDVVEAMSSARPYRPALGIDKALEEIAKNRGTLYDPEVVDASLRLFTEKWFEFGQEE